MIMRPRGDLKLLRPPDGYSHKEMRSSDSKLGEDKVKLARIQYRGKGKYIDEILY